MLWPFLVLSTHKKPFSHFLQAEGFNRNFLEITYTYVPYIMEIESNQVVWYEGHDMIEYLGKFLKVEGLDDIPFSIISKSSTEARFLVEVLPEGGSLEHFSASRPHGSCYNKNVNYECITKNK